MPFFKSHPDNAGPANVFTAYPEIYRLWSEMSQALMNGSSPLSSGEREMIASFTVGVAGCKFAYVAHSQAAYAHGVKEGLIDELLTDIETADIGDKLKPIFRFVKKLTLTPAEMSQDDADAVFAVGWDEKALHDAIECIAAMHDAAIVPHHHVAVQPLVCPGEFISSRVIPHRVEHFLAFFNG